MQLLKYLYRCIVKGSLLTIKPQIANFAPGISAVTKLFSCGYLSLPSLQSPP